MKMGHRSRSLPVSNVWGTDRDDFFCPGDVPDTQTEARWRSNRIEGIRLQLNAAEYVCGFLSIGLFFKERIAG